MSRRETLRLIGGSLLAIFIGSHLSQRARAQGIFETRAQILHAAPGGGTLEILFNWEKVLDAFPYGESSDWLDIEPGNLRLNIRRERIALNYTIFEALYPIVAGNDYRLIISDPLVIPVVVDRGPLAEGTSRVRLIQASVDTPPVDVASEGQVLIENLPYGELSDPVDLAAGTYDLEIRPHGIDEPSLVLPDLTFEPGMVYDLVVMGTPGSMDEPLTVAVLADEVRSGEPGATPTP